MHAVSEVSLSMEAHKLVTAVLYLVGHCRDNFLLLLSGLLYEIKPEALSFLLRNNIQWLT